MPNSRTKDTELAKRRTIAAEMYLNGATRAAIAQEVGVSRATIQSDLAAIRVEWKESRIRDFDEAKALELAKLDNTEREAWAAWERSQKNAVKVKTSQEGDFEKVEKWSEGQTGDPRFLQTVLTSIQRRCALLGLDAPFKHAQTDTQGNDITTPEQARAYLAELADTLRQRAGSGEGAASGCITPGDGGSPSTNGSG